MGILDWLTRPLGQPGSGVPGRRSQVDPGQLLKAATQLKQDGDLDGAIAALREAFAAYDRQGEVTTTDTYLRLPMYLQAADRRDEAWAEFHRLLDPRHPASGSDRQLRPMLESKIYDKMRLFLQRDKRPREAVPPGVASYVLWAVGLDRQGRVEELEGMRDEEYMAAAIAPLLKKAKRDDLLEDLVEYTAKVLRRPRNLDAGRVLGDVRDIVSAGA